MDYKKYKDYSVEEFVLNDDFVEWVLHPTRESDQILNGFLREYPEKKQEVKKAVTLIRSMRAVEPAISKQNLDSIYRSVTDNHVKERRIGWIVSRVAAVLLLLVTLGGVVYYLQNTSQSLPFEIAKDESAEKGKIILPDGTVSEFETEQTQITQNTTGEISINNDTVLLAEVSEGEEKPAMAQVIIPYGKRSEITLTDGTQIWLNAGSHLSYPVKFTGNNREVYLSGEAFFDVVSDPLKPFHVITANMKIKVTGTRFNVTSYANDQSTQAVLVEGKINAAKNKMFSRPVELQPGERVVYHKQEDNLSKDKVNVELYASWVDGYLIFQEEPISSIFRRLERYYNKRIIVEDEPYEILFTGKLDLADKLEEVLKNIAFSASFKVENNDGVFNIKY